MHRVRVRVVEDALDANNTIARANRDDFDRHGVTVVNVMSAPGAGKTTLLERILRDGTRRPARRRAGGRRAGLAGRRPPRAPARPRDAAQHRQRLRRRVPPRREHGPLGAAVAAARRDRPAHRRERRQPRLPGRVPHRRGRARSWSPRSPRATTSRASTRSCSAPASSWSSTRSTCSSTSTSRWTASTASSTRCTRASSRMRVSARTGEGVDALRDWLVRAARPGGRRRPDAAPPRRSTSASPAASGSSPPRRSGSRGSATAMAERFARGGRLRRVRVLAGGRAATCATSPSSSCTRSSSASARCPRSACRARTPALLVAPRRHRDGLRLRAPTSRRPCGRPRATGCLTSPSPPVGAECEFERPDRRPVRRPGAGRDDLPRAVGARARLLRAPRAADRARRAARATTRAPRRSSTRSSARPRTTSTRSSPTSRGRCWPRRREAGALRAQTLGEGREALAAAARVAARRASHGGGKRAGARQRRLGHRRDGRRRRPAPPAAAAGAPRPAIDLDRGPVDPHRGRQRRRRRGDVRAPGHRLRPRRATRCSRSPPAAARPTSSPRWREARRRGLVTIALVGYDGGRIARRGPGRPRRRHPLRAHPAHPGGAGQRVARAARAGRG